MRVQTLALVWFETLIHSNSVASHALSSTPNMFKLFIRVDESLQQPLPFLSSLDVTPAVKLVGRTRPGGLGGNKRQIQNGGARPSV